MITGYNGLKGRRLTPRELEFASVCAVYIAAGTVPTVTKLHRHGFGNGKTIRGNYVKIRTAMLEAAGYAKSDYDTTRKDRWTPPPPDAVAYARDEEARRDRRQCSVCSKPGEWYQFDMSGRCAECQP